MGYHHEMVVGSGAGRIFVSYARADDEPFVQRMVRWLTEDGQEVWFDRDAMASRGRTFRQELVEAIHESDRLILVVGPQAAVSSQVRAEWQQAWQTCKVVVPVLRHGDACHVPVELRSLHRIDARVSRRERDVRAELIRVLRDPVPPLGKLLNLDPLPEHHVLRKELLDQVARAVLGDLARPHVATSSGRVSALYGMGGVGKSVLATAFATACTSRRAFQDGIVRISLGRDPQLLEAMQELAGLLGDHEFSSFATLIRTQARVTEQLAGRRVLLIIDDVWDTSHAAPFLATLGAHSRALLTTRQGTIVSAVAAHEVLVDPLTHDQATDLLAHWLEREATDDEKALVRECGHLPFAVAICGAMLRDGFAAHEILRSLEGADLGILDHEILGYQYRDVLRVMTTSLDVLGERNPLAAELYRELHVFSASVDIPRAAVFTLWRHGRSIADVEMMRVLVALARAALLRIIGVGEAATIRLHDLQRDYLMTIDLVEEPARHRRLLAAYRAKALGGWADGPDDGYFFRHLCFHLAAAEELADLLSRGTDAEWLEKMLASTSPGALASDLRLIGEFADGEGDDCSFDDAAKAVLLSAGVLHRHADQLLPHLFGRLVDDDGEISELLRSMRATVRHDWWRPLRRVLDSPRTDALLGWQATTSGSVEELRVDAAGQRVLCRDVAGVDRVWDLNTAGELDADHHKVFAPEDGVTLQRMTLAVAVSRLSMREKLRSSGGELIALIPHARPESEIDQESRQRSVNHPYHALNRVHTLTGLNGNAKAIAISFTDIGPRGTGTWFLSSLVLIREETMHLLYNVRTHLGEGEDKVGFRGGRASPVAAITALAVSPDRSRLIAGCSDGSIRQWEIGSLTAIPVLEAAASMITAIAETAGTSLVVGTVDGRISVASETMTQAPSDVQRTDDAPCDVIVGRQTGRALVLGSMGTLELWDFHTGRRLATRRKLEHASAASDWSVRFWNFALTSDDTFAALFFVDDDMYGGLGILGVSLVDGSTTLIFDPDRKAKRDTAQLLGVGVSKVATNEQGRYVVTTATGVRITQGEGRWIVDAEDSLGPPSKRIEPSLRSSGGSPIFDDGLHVADDPRRLECAGNVGRRAAFVFDEPVVAARATGADRIVVLTEYGTIAFLVEECASTVRQTSLPPMSEKWKA